MAIIICINTTKNKYEVKQYERMTYQEQALGTEDSFATNLCVLSDKDDTTKLSTQDNFHGMFLANLTDKDIIVSDNIHNRIYPASTTKLMTLYVALKYGAKSETITVSANAVDIPWDSSKAGLYVGDQVDFDDLLYGLMLPSGNDAALAVAEAVAGNVDDFVDLMNKEAKRIGATNTHFMSPHGYHHKKHYTTVYDLYLILNTAIKNETFCDIVSEDAYSATITGNSGFARNVTWYQTNQFIVGPYEAPNGVKMIGGKTGTTDEAGACLTLYVQDGDGDDYISIIMGADNKPVLYSNMTELLSMIVE